MSKIKSQNPIRTAGIVLMICSLLLSIRFYVVLMNSFCIFPVLLSYLKCGDIGGVLLRCISLITFFILFVLLPILLLRYVIKPPKKQRSLPIAIISTIFATYFLLVALEETLLASGILSGTLRYYWYQPFTPYIAIAFCFFNGFKEKRLCAVTLMISALLVVSSFLRFGGPYDLSVLLCLTALFLVNGNFLLFHPEKNLTEEKQLKQLKLDLESGAITEEEYTARRAEIINNL